MDPPGAAAAEAVRVAATAKGRWAVNAHRHH